MNLPKILHAAKCIAMVQQFATGSSNGRCKAAPVLAVFSAAAAPAMKVPQKARRRGGGHGARGGCWPLVIDDQRNSLNTSISRARTAQKARSPAYAMAGVGASTNRSKACLWPASPYVLPGRRPLSRRSGRAAPGASTPSAAALGVCVPGAAPNHSKHQPTTRMNA